MSPIQLISYQTRLGGHGRTQDPGWIHTWRLRLYTNPPCHSAYTEVAITFLSPAALLWNPEDRKSL